MDKDTCTELLSFKESSDNNPGIARFETTPQTHDVNEHSLEMHLPYLYRRISETFPDPKDFPPIIPITVGYTNFHMERLFGKMLAPYLKDPTSVFIVSSDFCHWGSNFDYFYYMPKAPARGVHLDQGLTGLPSQNGNPTIHESIRRLDEMGMDAIERGKHAEFRDYLLDTDNTICGRHPIGVVMAAIEYLRENSGSHDSANDGKFKFVHYDRSGLVENMSQYSVSYASAYAVL